ncbi:MAG: class I SAM-dependent methyltransferase [Candidatus Poribacteria bacterium]
MWDQNYALSELPDNQELDEELDFICDVLNLDEESIILDLCCGQGRHTNGLAESGYFVIGLDSSRELLNIAQKYSYENTFFIEGDMRNIPLKKNSCDAVINMFTSFGFFDDEKNLKVLKGVSYILKRKGRFLLDYWNPYAVPQLDNVKNWWWIDEKTLSLAEASYDFPSGRLQDKRTIIDFKKGSIHKSVRDIRFYTLPELDSMLKSVGMRIIETFGDIDGRSYDADSRRLITLSEKIK